MDDKQSDLENKYHVLALEYSKIRSQATVLKKAVLEEQSKNGDLKNTLKDTEQKLRKRDHEIDSLTFRNEQLTKRISVLQQELQSNSHGKKNKSKVVENSEHYNISIIDEELHKKILENAELVSKLADNEIEIQSANEQIRCLEQQLDIKKNELTTQAEKYQSTVHELLLEKQNKTSIQDHKSTSIDNSEGHANTETTFYWQKEAERYQTECEVLRLRPTSNEKLTEYYESQIRDLLESKQLAFSETRNVNAENIALASRLEQVILEKNHLEKSILTNADELNTTSNNYKSQLDAMTEHLAAQNETIAKQCDQIQELKHRLSFKK